jgi:hypothetical protein
MIDYAEPDARCAGVRSSGAPTRSAAVPRHARNSNVCVVMRASPEWSWTASPKSSTLGRRRRFPTPAQFRALTLGDQHCRFPGCDRPPEWTDAHHLVPDRCRSRDVRTNDPLRDMQINQADMAQRRAALSGERNESSGRQGSSPCLSCLLRRASIPIVFRGEPPTADEAHAERATNHDAH